MLMIKGAKTASLVIQFQSLYSTGLETQFETSGLSHNSSQLGLKKFAIREKTSVGFFKLELEGAQSPVLLNGSERISSRIGNFKEIK